jgi:hypothetical protein
MTKQRYIITDGFICRELEYVRTMLKTHDFSQLAAVIERIQIHANAMESGLGVKNERIRKLQAALRDGDASADHLTELLNKEY